MQWRSGVAPLPTAAVERVVGWIYDRDSVGTSGDSERAVSVSDVKRVRSRCIGHCVNYRVTVKCKEGRGLRAVSI